MRHRGCAARTARKRRRRAASATSIPPPGSLATSFTKPIPQWDQMDADAAAVGFNQSEKPGAHQDVHLREDVNSFLLCLCVRDKTSQK